jgi:hypothetical protein
MRNFLVPERSDMRIVPSTVAVVMQKSEIKRQWPIIEMPSIGVA